MIADTLRLEEKNYRNIETLMQLLKASGPDATSQELYENAVEADRGIILLYKNLCEAWAECQNLYKKADDKINAVKEESDKYHDELNEKIDEVNNYLNALIQHLDAKVDDNSNLISDLTLRLIHILNFPGSTPGSNVIRVTPSIQNGYTEIAKVQEFHNTDPIEYEEKSVKLPYEIFYSERTNGYFPGPWRSNYEVYSDWTTGKKHPVYYQYVSWKFTAPGSHDFAVIKDSHYTGPLKIIDIESVIEVKKTQLPFIYTLKNFSDINIGPDGGSINDKKVRISGDIYEYRNPYTDNLDIVFDFSKTQQIIDADPTTYTAPEYIQCIAIVKVADLGEEITL